MRSRLFSALVALALAPAAMAQQRCVGSRDLASPDGALIAHVSRLGRGACGESKVEILTADGHLLLTADYSSSDGDHGEGLAMAAWSADSRFFAYSLADSADKAPSRYRVDVFRRDGNKLRPLSVLAPNLVVTQPGLAFDDRDALEVTTDKGVVPVDLGGR